MRWHDDDHSAEPETSKKPSRADAIERRLHELKRLAQEVELEWQLTKEAQGRRKGRR